MREHDRHNRCVCFQTRVRHRCQFTSFERGVEDRSRPLPAKNRCRVLPSAESLLRHRSLAVRDEFRLLDVRVWPPPPELRLDLSVGVGELGREPARTVLLGAVCRTDGSRPREGETREDAARFEVLTPVDRQGRVDTARRIVSVEVPCGSPLVMAGPPSGRSLPAVKTNDNARKTCTCPVCGRRRIRVRQLVGEKEAGVVSSRSRGARVRSCTRQSRLRRRWRRHPARRAGRPRGSAESRCRCSR